MSLKKRIKLFKNVEERAIVERRKLTPEKEGESEIKEIDVIVFPLSWFKELKLECIQ